jgi:hypothetical protein
MNKQLLSIVCFLFVMHAAIAQTVVTVNNTAGEPATYRTLQGAVDSVADGTIILLQPSGISYGNAIIRKRVGIIGAGYFLGLNPDPNTQAYLQPSVTGWLQFDLGSNGSYIMGLSLTGDINNQGNNRLNFQNTSNITISRCLISPSPSTSHLHHASYSSGINISQCYYLVPGGFGHAVLFHTRESSGIQFSNNIFENQGAPTYGFMLPTEHFTNYSASFTYINNVMIGLYNPGFYPSQNTFINNVVFKVNPNDAPLGSVGADRNVGNADFTSGGTNISNATLNSIFQLGTGPVATGPDGRYQLANGSPAIGYGQGGIDCGAFGGAGAYVLSGIPLIPNVYFAAVQGTPTSTGGLKLRLKVKAN